MNMMALVIIMLLLGIGYAHGKLRLGKSPKTEITFSPTFNGGKHVLPSWVLEQIDPLASSQATTITYPPCIDSEKDLAYVNGMLSETQTFYNCLQAITDPMSLPTKENGTVSGILPVYSSIQLNNLHEVDAVAGTVTIDFYLRLYWRDDRFAMPIFWKKVDKRIQTFGIEITPLLSIGNSSVGVFLPDVRFHDASELEYIVQTIRFNSSNVFFWSRHTKATFMQPTMVFDNYPADQQVINIRFGSYAYDQTWLVMGFTPSAPISFNENFDGSKTFMVNPSWSYDEDTTSYSTYVSSSGFLNVIYHIGIQRKGSGIVLRLILPITLLCFLGGLTFWAQYDARVDSTITLLLAVSALYIVILANIPLVGYLTSMDTYIFWMFLLLVFAVVLHQIYAGLQEDRDAWPMRIFFGRAVESIGRIAIFPVVTYLFITLIKDVNQVIRAGMVIITAFVGLMVVLREINEVVSHYKTAIRSLLAKLNSEEILLKELSSIELFFVNYYEFNRYSTSPLYLSEYLEKTGKIDVPKSKSIPLRKYSTIKHPHYIPTSNAGYDDEEGYQLATNEVDFQFSEENPQHTRDDEAVNNGEQSRRSSLESNDNYIRASLENVRPISNKSSAGGAYHEEKQGTVRSTLRSNLRQNQTSKNVLPPKRSDSDDDYAPKRYHR